MALPPYSERREQYARSEREYILAQQRLQDEERQALEERHEVSGSADQGAAQRILEQKAEQEAAEYQYLVRQARARDALLAQARAARASLEEAEEERPTLFGYSAPLTLAGLKDLLDIGFIGSVPVVGTAITFCFSFLIFALLFLTKTNHSLLEMRRFIVRLVAFAGGALFELFGIGVNLLPVQTLSVLVIFWIDRHFSDETIEKLAEAAHRFR